MVVHIVVGNVFLLVSILSCGILATVVAIVALVQGIMMMTMRSDEFERKYIYSTSTMPLF